MAAAPTYVGAGNVATGTGAITPTYPAGLQNGDILILQLCTADDGGVDVGGATFGGTLIGEARSGGGGSTDCRCTAYWALSDGTESGGSCSVPDNGSGNSARITAWRGCDTVNPIEADVGIQSTPTLNTSVQWDTITTTVDNVMVLLMHSAGDNNTTSTPSAGNLEARTELYDHVFTTHDDYNMQLSHAIMLSAGATGTPSATQVGSEQDAQLTIGLMPLIPGGAADEPIIIMSGF